MTDNDSEAPESLCAGLGYVVFVVASIAREQLARCMLVRHCLRCPALRCATVAGYLNVALPIRMYYMGSRSYLQAEGHG